MRHALASRLRLGPKAVAKESVEFSVAVTEPLQAEMRQAIIPGQRRPQAQAKAHSLGARMRNEDLDQAIDARGYVSGFSHSGGGDQQHRGFGN